MRNLTPFKRNDLDYDSGIRNFYNMIDDFFDNSFTPSVAMKEASFKVDIQENDKEYLVEAELPGFDKKEVNVSMEDGKLTISACRNEEFDKSDEKKNYIHKERRTSSMSRSMYFDDADSENIRAKLEGGILTIDVPKRENLENKRVIDIE